MKLLTGRLIPGGPCGGGLEVPPKLNNASSECVEATSRNTLDMVIDTTGKLSNNSLIMGKVSLTLVTQWRG